MQLLLLLTHDAAKKFHQHFCSSKYGMEFMFLTLATVWFNYTDFIILGISHVLQIQKSSKLDTLPLKLLPLLKQRFILDILNLADCKKSLLLVHQMDERLNQE